MADYGPLYQAAGNQFNIDPLLLQSMAAQESGQGANLGPSSAGAKGFMQFLPSTAAKYGVDVNDATSSVFGASNYLNDLMNQHGESLPHALADYGGTTPDSQYVKDVTSRYNTLKAAWAKTGPGTSGAGPTTDTDPSSPTYGQSTGKNFTPPPSTPGADTTAKGNAGQPSPSVPTTDTGPGVSMAAPSTFAPPQAGGPQRQAQAKTPPVNEKNDPLSQAKPHVNEDGTPITPAQAAPSEQGDALSRAQPHVSESGEPIQPVDTGQYLTSAASPGAQSVGSSAEIAEGREPGPAVQAAINVATDPGQRARIAASQLGIPLDRIVIGQGNRLAAVDEQGQRYYIQPPPVFADQGGLTKVPGPIWNRGDGTWQPLGGAQVTPYSRAAPLGPGATAANVPLAMGAAIPNTVQNYLTWAPAGLGGAVAGPVGVGLASAGTTAARNMLANYLDPDKSQAVPLLTPEDTRQALINAGSAYGLRFLGGQFEQGLNRPLESPGVLGGEYGPNLGTSTQFPGRPPMPIGPSVPLEARPLEPGMVVNDAQRGRRLIQGPGAAAGAEGILDPFEGAGEASGPYAPTSAAEASAQPTTMAPMRLPPMSKQAVEERADEVIRNFAGVGNRVPDSRQLISNPDLAQSLGNSGISALARSMATNTPEGMTAFQAFRDAQLSARRNFTRNLVGTNDDLVAARATRAANTQQTYGAAFGPGETTQVNAQPVVDAINDILKSPEGVKAEVAEPLRDIRSWFYEKDPLTGVPLKGADGNPVLMSDPERLYMVRQQIAHSKIGPLSTSAGTDSRRAADLIDNNVEGVLDRTIAEGAPNYPAYMQQYREQSGPITAMEFLQGRNLTDAFGDTTLAKVDGAIKAAENQRDLKLGATRADALTDDQMQQLYMLRDDLRRQANITKGKAIGSDTAQNLATSSVYNALTGPVARTARTALLGGLGVHESGSYFGALAGPYAEHFVENYLTNRAANTELAVRQAVIRRLLNQDGSGTRALLGQPEPDLEP